MRPPQRRLRDLFRFSKPKTIGYEIAKEYYLSILIATPTLPSPREVMNPQGQGGALTGMLAPLAKSEKADLSRPMDRGLYALASVDQKTVLKAMVMPRDEAGFDPQPFLRSALAAQFPEEIRHRIAATWHVAQLTFEAFDPQIAPALDFFLGAAQRLASLTEGVVADPIAQRYLLPEEVFVPNRVAGVVNAAEHLSIKHHPGARAVHTLGLGKFHIPELEITELDAEDFPLAELFLLSVGQTILKGQVPELEMQIGPFFVTHGGTDRRRWEGLPVFELAPPTGITSREALRSWADAESRVLPN